MDNKDLLANLYDKVYELLTAAPGGGAKVFEPSNIRVQMTQNEVLNLEDYADAISGSNPEGDLFAAEAISNFVDKIPDFGSTLWAPKENLARTYKNIVSGANEDPGYMPDKKREDTYKKLQKMLVKQVTVKEMERKLNLDTAEFEDVPTGKTTTTVSDTPLYAAYKEAKAAYESALLDAKDVVLNADLTTNEGKRRASVDKKRADLEVEAKYKNWVARGKSDIDQILNALEALKNDSISAAISDAKSVMDDAKWISSGSESGQDWILSSVTPSNWTEPTIKGTTLTISSDNLKTSTSKTASTYSKKSKGWFWYGSSSSSGETQTKNVDLKAESFKLSGELVLVRIQRSWLNQQLFTMKGWTNNAYPDAGDISDGEGKGALPGIPVAFLMMRNVSIEAKFNQSDSDYIHTENKSKSRSGWGWGPFGGSSRSSTSESTTDNFESTGDGVKITFDQPQVVAWISTLVPKCPPEK